MELRGRAHSTAKAIRWPDPLAVESSAERAVRNLPSLPCLLVEVADLCMSGKGVGVV